MRRRACKSRAAWWLAALTLAALTAWAVPGHQIRLQEEQLHRLIGTAGGNSTFKLEVFYLGTFNSQETQSGSITINSLYYNVWCCTPITTAGQGIVSEGYLPTPGVGSNLSFGLPLPVGT